MPTTRSQNRRKTRSSSHSTSPQPPCGPGTTTGQSNTVKRRQTQATPPSKSSCAASSPTRDTDIAKLIRHILWNLINKLYPSTTVILKPFKRSHQVPVFVIIVLLLVLYAFPNLIFELGGGFWQDWFTPELSGIKELSAPPRHRWVWREDEVLNVTTRIARLSKGDNDGRQIHMYLVGGPGAGKSELARQVGITLYESLKQDKRPVDVLTIEAASIASLMTSLTDAIFALCNSSGQKTEWIKQTREELNFRLGDSFSNEGNVLKTEMRLKVLFSKLRELFKQRNSRPVLIFDNVRDLKVLFTYLNLEPGSKHFTTFRVIVTLQKRVSLERWSDYAQVQDLYDGMSSTDSVELLTMITGLKEDSEDRNAKELSNILGRQPLALATAAIYIESVREGPPRKSEYSYSDYITEFKRDIHMLGMEEEIEWQEGDSSKYADAMYTAVHKAVNLSAQTDPVLRELACGVGYTDSSPLSLTFVMDFLKTNPRYEFTEAQIRNSLRNVLFKVGGKDGEQFLGSHQVIREAFRRVCKVSRGDPNCLKSSVCALNTRQASEGHHHNLLTETLARIALTFERQLNFTISNAHNRNAAMTESNSNFGSQFLDILTSLCVFSSREHMEVAEILNTNFSGMFLQFFSHSLGYWPGLIKPVSNEFRLKELVDLANLKANAMDLRYDLQTVLLVVCLHNGATKAQKENLTSAMNKTSAGIVKLTVQRAVPDNGNLMPVLLNILGVMYRSLGYPHNSRHLHEFALDIHNANAKTKSDGDKNVDRFSHSSSNSTLEVKSREDTLEMASTLHKLGIINRYLSNLTSAQACHETSLQLLQDLFGAEHPYIAGSLLNLAVVYSRQGKSREALELHNRSLIILEKSNGPGHPNIGRVLVTIGTVFYKLGEFTKATDYTERGLEILEDFHGTYHPHVAEALNFLGFMYRDQGNLEKAREVLERSVRIKETMFDANHFILGEAMNDLGVVYTRLGEARNAKKILERALSIFKKTWGERHSAVATTTNSLGAAYCALGEPQVAVVLHQKALSTFLNISNGAEGHSVAETRNLLGNAYMAIGRREDARVMYRLAYTGFSKLYNTEHWRVVGALTRLNSLESVINGARVVGSILLINSLSSLVGMVCI